MVKETLQQFCCKRSIAFTNRTRKVHTSDTRDGKYYKVQMDKGKRPVLLIQWTGPEFSSSMKDEVDALGSRP